ncbi:hypothetical protein NDU88_005267 [Pleurodeles waltl]|uniref:Uncharacterized protein n=1 Tax=Pleurodeles waltl TaxID=8319 RepID=A0AAV7X0P5_PLEWA|nr:hypothetical protein NDU88_005267 [Pleurodeles waltl]
MQDRYPWWKCQTPYEPEVWRVAKINGTIITAQQGDDTVRQNVSRDRVVPNNLKPMARVTEFHGPPGIVPCENEETSRRMELGTEALLDPMCFGSSAAEQRSGGVAARGWVLAA